MSAAASAAATKVAAQSATTSTAYKKLLAPLTLNSGHVLKNRYVVPRQSYFFHFSFPFSFSFSN